MTTTAVHPTPSRLADHHVPLSGDWDLWRDFAIRSAGFPVSGLKAFGSGDEPVRLRGIARDSMFREAVTWQNPAALDHAIAKLADGSPAKPSRTRQREELVASYWQRYCAKNDTIGFFGPLAWGRINDAGAPLSSRSGALVRERDVHLEAWGVQALAAAIDPELTIATGPHAAADLRAALDTHSDAGIRKRGLGSLDRFERALDLVARAPAESLREALAALDATFSELTGRDPVRNAGRAYGARTLVYIDCMRDLDLTLGSTLVSEIAPGLQVLFEAGRWYSGRVNEFGKGVIEQSLPPGGRGPFGPVLGRVLRTLFEQCTPEIEAGLAEMHRRLAVLLADPRLETIAARATAMFADHRPAWPTGVFQSVDLQIAAPHEAAVADSDWLAVVGDMHPGANPLVQGVFAHRHPNPRAMLDLIRATLGRPLPLLLPPFAPGMGQDGRGMPLTAEDDIHLAAMADAKAPPPRRTWLPHELFVEDGDLVDRDGSLRVALTDALGIAIFIAGVRLFELLPEDEHVARVTVGHTVLRREGWNVPADEVPRDAEVLSAFARERGMPRRLFAKSPLERKPMYLDVESPVLARILSRHARRAAAQAPGAAIRFTEMLPTPEQCWLSDAEGNRYVSELRLVAVDRSHRFR
ncbi:MAG TPA: lantibiotic dehydratase [Solirubrobacteraceae bacterium]|nr:lantibiotic dehydratase [Solirubrobacteraceae bacterium]